MYREVQEMKKAKSKNKATTKKRKSENDDAPIEFKTLKKYKSGATVVQYDAEGSKPLIRIPTSANGRFYKQFGVNAAKAMVEHIQSLSKFAKDYAKKE